MHFLARRRRLLKVYWGDADGQAFVAVTLAASQLVALFLLWREQYADFCTAWCFALFNTVSIATMTGYASTDDNQRPTFAPALMLFLSCFATCAGSTGGGIKMIRAIIPVKQARRECARILHPRIVNPVRLAGQVVVDNVVAMLVFLLIYGGALIGSTLLLMASGLDPISSYTAIVASLNNTGPGLNQVGPATNDAGLMAFENSVCAFAMLIGRLELMSALVLFTSAFWRK